MILNVIKNITHTDKFMFSTLFFGKLKQNKWYTSIISWLRVFQNNLKYGK